MTNFQIYPAVDLKDGNCVRLLHGKEKKMTIYENDPIKQVKFFAQNGFKWVHIVDLNAAFGKYDNKKVILKILKKSENNIKIQLGGGIKEGKKIINPSKYTVKGKGTQILYWNIKEYEDKTNKDEKMIIEIRKKIFQKKFNFNQIISLALLVLTFLLLIFFPDYGNPDYPSYLILF